MNQSFDTGRWWLLVSKHWSENRKKYTLSLIAIAGLMLLWFIIALVSEPYSGIHKETQISAYYTGLFLVGCLYGSMLFSDLGSKTRGLNYLVVPASHLEKLLCALFYAVVVFFVFYNIIFYTLDFLMVKAGNTLAYSYWVKAHVAASSFTPQEVLNVIYQKEGRGQYEPFTPFYILLLYFVLQSLFICGSVYFAKFSFIKTVISSLLIGLVIVFLTVKVVAHILPAGNYYHGITSYQVYTVKDAPEVKGIMIYSDPETDKLVSIPGWIGDVILFVLKFAFAPLFWLAAYYRLKEKEI
jgi:multisubunit Na+/H+ antiporter MnhG subunit